MSPRTLIKEIYKGPKSQQVPGLVPAPPNNATTTLVISNWAWARGSKCPLVALWAWEAYNEPIGQAWTKVTRIGTTGRCSPSRWSRNRVLRIDWDRDSKRGPDDRTNEALLSFSNWDQLRKNFSSSISLHVMPDETRSKVTKAQSVLPNLHYFYREKGLPGTIVM